MGLRTQSRPPRRAAKRIEFSLIPAPRYEAGAFFSGAFFRRNALPTQAKIDRVNELKEKLERCSIAVATNYSGISVNEMIDLRRRMRAAGVEFTVVKNNLMKLACDASQRSQAKTS